jgi:Mg-chelatase subunit ChlD
MDMTLLNSYDNKAAVKSAIDSIDDDGMTAMGEGMADANDLLINHGRSDARKVMIVLTDGETNSGDDRDGEDAIVFANANGVTIYTIGLGSSLDEALLRHIASETGGAYYNAPDSSDLSEIYNTIAQELSDYDISDIEYGVEGFTPYDYTFHGSLELQEYTLRFDGYDLDYTFDAGSDYGGSSAGECLIRINGTNFKLIPSHDTDVNEEWDEYEYDISNYLTSGPNTISFYDYYAYDGHGDWNNRIRNVNILHNGASIAYYPDNVELDADGYNCIVDAIEAESFEETFLINETINDLKVQLDWEDSSSDLNAQLISPSGIIYGPAYNTTGYYPVTDTSEYIWIQPLSYLYPDNDYDSVEQGIWTIRVTGSGTGTENFIINTYIDKKSAAKLSSHAFMSSFDESRGDKAGLALYSFEDVVESNNQTSYLLDDSTWVGYFTAGTDGFHTFNVTWDDTSSIDAYLYDGIEVLDSSGGTGACEISSMLSAGSTYHVEVVKGAGPLTDTRFTINVSTSPMDSVMATYYDSSGGSGSPRYRTWDGSDWSGEESANYVEGRPYSIVLEANPMNSEFIMGTGNDNYVLNVQVWDGSSWNGITQLTDGLSSYSTRGFDIKYEQKSGDAIAVYGDGYWSEWRGWRYQYTGYSSPRYRIWDGSSWSPESTVDGSNFGAGDISWVRLEANPNSNEMVLVTLDDERDMRAQIWDGSSWDNQVILTDNAVTASYQCFDVMYEQDSGRAIVVWADNDGHVKYRIWDGNSWDPVADMYPYSSDVYWIKMAAHPNLDQIILATEDRSHDIYVTDWNGSSWQTPQRVESDVYDNSRRSVDVTFEQSSGKGIVVWGDGSSTPKYCTWNGSWSDEKSASTIGFYPPQWVKLIPSPDSNELFLMTSGLGYSLYDSHISYSDISIQKWDGSSWGTASNIETYSTDNYECFDLAFSGHGASAESTSWNQWTASVTSTLENDSLSHLENAIDTMTADGLTAIDEGMYAANNELSSVDGNSTMVIMTDGLDNAGYHSLLEEAHRAKENNTIIYTVGFGNDESEVDPVLAEVAEITGGEYYFAPNSSVLKDIFTGIASQITNFSAGGPVLDIHVPHNYITSSSAAKATYISGSSNSTTGNATLFMAPTAPATGNAEPTITTSGNSSSLEWQLPNMGPGDKWGVWYQMRVDGAGYVPIIMPTSTVTYTDLGGENITVYIPSGGSASVGGGGANVL